MRRAGRERTCVQPLPLMLDRRGDLQQSGTLCKREKALCVVSAVLQNVSVVPFAFCLFGFTKSRATGGAPDICSPYREGSVGSVGLERNPKDKKKKKKEAKTPSKRRLHTHLLKEILAAVDSPLGGSQRETERDRENKYTKNHTEHSVFTYTV